MIRIEKANLIGEVTHYYNRLGVAIVELRDALGVGETIQIAGAKKSITQKVTSIEIQHQRVDRAQAGDSIGLKVNGKVQEGHQVFRV